jgi:hypothetical protein
MTEGFRVRTHTAKYRVLYVFDPRRSALLVLGGDKTGDDRWYEVDVPRAETICRQYLEELRKEGVIP